MPFFNWLKSAFCGRQMAYPYGHNKIFYRAGRKSVVLIGEIYGAEERAWIFSLYLGSGGTAQKGR